MWVTRKVWVEPRRDHKVIGVYKDKDWYVRSFETKEGAAFFQQLLNSLLELCKSERMVAFVEWKRRWEERGEPYPRTPDINSGCYYVHLTSLFFDARNALVALDERFGWHSAYDGMLDPEYRLPDTYRYSTEERDDI